MKKFGFSFLVLLASALYAHADPYLGSAATFAVLGASTVTNTGATTLNGNLGLYPGTSITGSGTITLTGASVIDNDNGVAQTAQADALTGYDTLAALPASDTLTGQDLGTVGTLDAGVYFFATSAQLTGALTLNFQGDSNESIVIEIGTTLTTASGSSVSIENAGSDDNVYWVVGSSATLGTGTSFMGNIIAQQSVTMNTSATDSCGSVIALNAAVTLDNNTITNTCNVVASGTTIGTFGGTVSGTTGQLENNVVSPVLGSASTPVSLPESGSSFLYLCFLLVPIAAMWVFYRRSAGIV